MKFKSYIEAKIIDGIKCFKPDVAKDHEDYHSCGLDKHYKAEKDHFWFISRRNRIVSAFSRYTETNSHIIEIGAGTGYVARGLQDAGYTVAVGEIHLSGLRYARENGLEECYQFDLFDPPFEDEFDAIGMFDVLEHLDRDVFALQQVGRMLKSGGKLYITVPAHQWLWSRDDKASHKRRYSKRQLVNIVKKSGFHILEARYYFCFILPLLYLRTLLNPDFDSPLTDEELHSDIHINPVINKLLLYVCQLENMLYRFLPNIAGGSLLLVAQKQ